MGSFDFRNQHVLEAAQRSFSKTGIIRGDVTGGTSGTSFPGDLNGFEPTLPNCAPPGSIPERRPAPPAATTSRATSTSFRRTSRPHPGQGQLRDHARSRGVGRVPACEEPADLARRRGADQPPDAGEQPVLPCRRARRRSAAFRPEQPGRPQRPGRRRQLASGAGRQADQRRRHHHQPAARRARRQLRRRLGLQDRPRHQPQHQRRLGQQGLRQRRPDAGTACSTASSIRSAPRPPTGQAAIDAAQVSEPTQIGKAHVDFIDFKVSKELWQMGGGATGFAFGAEARKEKSKFEATDITATLGSLGIDPDSDTSRQPQDLCGLRRAEHAGAEEPRDQRRRPLRQVQRLRRHLQPEDRHPLPADGATGAQRLGQHRLPRADAV